MKKVTIIQRVLPHYRIPFFECLFERLEEHGITLHLVYGQEYPGTVPKTFDLNRTWGHRISNRYIRLGGKELVWQPCSAIHKNSDLIVIEQSNRLLLNFLLVSQLISRQSKIAYWGHGKNMQAGGKNKFSELIKKMLATKVDWWFAYTELSGNLIASLGFPTNRISVVQNTIDTRILANAIENLEEKEIHKLKRKLGISGQNICIFCGGMYPDKWIDFLLRTCQIIKKNIPDFHMLFIGNGPEENKIKNAAGEYSWIHYIGPVYGKELAPYLAMSQASLMPGLVGLGIIDSFVTGTPLFTTNNPIHSPEIQYLDNHINGIMVETSEDAFANSVIEYLKSRALQETLKRGCTRSAQEFTLENMVAEFTTGIEQALSL